MNTNIEYTYIEYNEFKYLLLHLNVFMYQNIHIFTNQQLKLVLILETSDHANMPIV